MGSQATFRWCWQVHELDLGMVCPYPGNWGSTMHVEHEAGLKEDLCTEGSLAIYMNYPFYVQFLDSALCKPRTTKYWSTSILKKNSSEMIAQLQLLSIFPISISMHFQYLAGKSQIQRVWLGSCRHGTCIRRVVWQTAFNSSWWITSNNIKWSCLHLASIWSWCKSSWKLFCRRMAAKLFTMQDYSTTSSHLTGKQIGY